MQTFSVIRNFKIWPNISLSIGDEIVKYDDVVAVVVDGQTLTQDTFWAWVGSVDSERCLSFVSQEPDDGNAGGLTPLPEGYTTTDIANRVDALVAIVRELPS